jgi:hypothetical protein
MMRLLGFLLLLAGFVPMPEAAAQRGGQHLNSPGYQRALIESRKLKSAPVPPEAAPRKKRVRRAPAAG